MQYLDEKDAVAQEAVENMMTLEAEIKSLKSEVRDLTAKLQYAEDGLVELKQAKQMAVIVSLSLFLPLLSLSICS
jgi:chromosome segregation ATPase